MDSIKWFDENGDEIIREPVNPDNLEYIAEVGGGLEESRVGINFYSESLEKNEITQLLGAKPTKAWNPGEQHPIGNKGRSRITNWGKWYLTTERDSADINDKLVELLNSLSKDLKIWEILTNKYEAWIDVAGYMENWNRGFSLKPNVMKMLAERNIEVIFDIYYKGDSEETE